MPKPDKNDHRDDENEKRHFWASMAVYAYFLFLLTCLTLVIVLVVIPFGEWINSLF